MTSTAAALIKHLRNRDDLAKVTNRDLATAIGKHERTVNRALVELVDQRKIFIERFSPSISDPTGRTIYLVEAGSDELPTNR